jgi:hypothetical protein
LPIRAVYPLAVIAVPSPEAEIDDVLGTGKRLQQQLQGVQFLQGINPTNSSHS